MSLQCEPQEIIMYSEVDVQYSDAIPIDQSQSINVQVFDVRDQEQVEGERDQQIVGVKSVVPNEIVCVAETEGDVQTVKIQTADVASDCGRSEIQNQSEVVAEKRMDNDKDGLDLGDQSEIVNRIEDSVVEIRVVNESAGLHREVDNGVEREDEKTDEEKGIVSAEGNRDGLEAVDADFKQNEDIVSAEGKNEENIGSEGKVSASDLYNAEMRRMAAAKEEKAPYKVQIIVDHIDKSVPKNYVCRLCKKPGHWMNNCSKYACKKCGLSGHLFYDCHSFTKADSSNQDIGKASKSNNGYPTIHEIYHGKPKPVSSKNNSSATANSTKSASTVEKPKQEPAKRTSDVHNPEPISKSKKQADATPKEMKSEDKNVPVRSEETLKLDLLNNSSLLFPRNAIVCQLCDNVGHSARGCSEFVLLQEKLKFILHNYPELLSGNQNQNLALRH